MRNEIAPEVFLISMSLDSQNFGAISFLISHFSFLIYMSLDAQDFWGNLISHFSFLISSFHVPGTPRLLGKSHFSFLSSRFTFLRNSVLYFTDTPNFGVDFFKIFACSCHVTPPSPSRTLVWSYVAEILFGRILRRFFFNF